VKKTPGLIQIILIEKNIKDGKVSYNGGSNLNSPETMLISAYKEEADIACAALYQGYISRLKHMSDFDFTSKKQVEKRESMYALFQLASSKVSLIVPPFTIQDFKERVCEELTLLKSKVTSSDLPLHVRFKEGVVLGNMRGDQDNGDLFLVKRKFDTVPFETNLKNLTAIVSKRDVYIVTSEACGSGQGYAVGSWFFMDKIREEQAAFIVRGPVADYHTVNEVLNLRATKLKMSSFIVTDPDLSEDESPALEPY
jgi:hypothetical protein